MVKTLFVMSLTLITASAHAQHFKNAPSLFSFLRTKDRPVYTHYRAPMLTTFQGNNNNFNYWQGSSYTTWSENGRVKSTYSFDINGQLRESAASVSLKKNGSLSYFRIQFSPQRNRPFFVYTIH